MGMFKPSAELRGCVGVGPLRWVSTQLVNYCYALFLKDKKIRQEIEKIPTTFSTGFTPGSNMTKNVGNKSHQM